MGVFIRISVAGVVGIIGALGVIGALTVSELSGKVDRAELLGELGHPNVIGAELVDVVSEEEGISVDLDSMGVTVGKVGDGGDCVDCVELDCGRLDLGGLTEGGMVGDVWVDWGILVCSMLDWGGLCGWGMGNLADLFRLYKFLESNKFLSDTNTLGIPCLVKASFTIDK